MLKQLPDDLFMDEARPNSAQGSAADSGNAPQPAVPDYELLRRIGKGSFGEVWLARSKATGIQRAAKIVWRHTFEEERPFQREFEGVQKFERVSREHPSQLALFHIGRNDAERYFYYVMELADGVEIQSPNSNVQNRPSPTVPTSDLYKAHTLRAELSGGRLPAERVLEIGLALAEALSHLHRHNLVHRDVKPSNVIFVNGRPKLADVGLVTDTSDQRSILGTEGYLLLESPGTSQADIFALGKVLYEAATGMDRREFPKLPEDLRGWSDAGLVFELNEIFLKACARDAGARYSGADAMLGELALLRRGGSVRQKRTRSQQLAIAKGILVAAVVAGVLAGSGFLLARQFRQVRPLSANPEAEKLYRRAVYQIQSRTLAPLAEAYTNLTSATRLDPRFVDAYYQIFELYMGSLGSRLPPYYNQYANFLTATTNLGALNPNSVQYHTAHSMVKFLEWKFDEAINEVELAIKINPKFMRAHGFYGFYMLLARGDTVTALEQFQIAERLDPADTVIQSSLGRPFYAERKFDLAINQFRKALRLERSEAAGHLNLGRAYEADKQYTNALEEYWQLALLNTEDPDKINVRFQKQRADLDEKGPNGWYEGLLKEARHEPKPNLYFMAALCAKLGRTKEAFDLLKQAYEQHSPGMERLIEDASWDPLRGEKEFQDLLRKMGMGPKH